MSVARATAMARDAAHRARAVRIDGRAVDITTRALVVGVLDGRARTDDAILAAAAAHVTGGADLLEVAAGGGGAPPAGAVTTLRSAFDAPIVVCTDDIAELRDALDAGASVARAVAPPSREYLDAVAVRGATMIVTDPFGDVERRAAASGLDAEQLVVETGPDGPGDVAFAVALGSLPRLVGRGHPVAWACEHPGAPHDPAVVAWAVASGARFVITHRVVPAVRMVRTLAAIDEATAP